MLYLKIEDYVKQLSQLGITEEDKQKKVLEYFYNLGTIIYKFQVNSYGKEN